MNEELYHFGVKGMKWGVTRKRKTYEQKLREDMETYNKQNPQRRKVDNYTIALRNASRKEENRALKVQILGMATLPLFGVGLPIAAGNMYVNSKRDMTISSIMDEYNIEKSKRVLNM